MRKFSTILVAAVAVTVFSAGAIAGTLDDVKKKGWVQCGVTQGLPGFSNPDQDGTMTCPESGLRYKEIKPGQLRCLDLDEDAPLPEDKAVGEIPYSEFRRDRSKDL